MPAADYPGGPEVMALGPVAADARPVSRTPGRDGERLHLGLHFAHVLIPPRRLLLQRPEDDFVQANVHLDLFRGSGEPAQRQFPGQHLVEYDPQGIDVGPVVDLERLLHLLGGHVAQRADHLLGAGERGVRRHRPQELGEAEVGDLDVAPAVEKDVLRLDIPVDDPLIVGVLERFADLRDDPERLLGFQPPLRGADRAG